MNTLLNIIFIFVLIIPLYAQNNAPEITGQEELSTPEDTPLTITFSDLSVEDVDNTYPDDFTLTVLEGDNYTIEGGSGGENSDTNPFEDLVTPNPSSGVFLAQATIDGTPAGEGDWSAAFDEDGNIAGAAAIMINAGTAYINMPIYGDDTTTPDVDEGMNAGESFVLKIWDSSTGDILDYPESFDCWYNNNGGPMNGCGNYTEVFDFPVSTGGDGNTIVPDENYFGDLTVPVYVDDGEAENSQSNTFDLLVTVTSVNDAGPVLGEIGPQGTDEDTPLTVTLSASDVDNDELIFSAESDNESVTVSVIGDQLIMTPAPDYFGTANITVTVSDEFLTDSETFELTVNPANDAPVIEDIAAQVMDEDATLTIILNASDVDGGSGEGDENDLTFSVVSDNDAISVSVDSTLLTVTPDTNYYGNATITVTVTDMGNRLTDETSFGVTVNNVNDSPVLTVIGNQSTNEDTLITLSVDFTDVDIHDPADTHTITVESSSPADVSVENLSGDVSGSTYDLVPSPDFFGTADITVTVMDNGEDSLTISEAYTLTVNAVNDFPVMAAISDTSTAEDTPLTITVSSSDADPLQEPSYLASSDNENVSVSLSGADEDGDQLTLTPVLNWSGSASIMVTVVDGAGGIDSASFELTVYPVNDAPVIDSSAVFTTLEEIPVEVTLDSLYVTDVDNLYPIGFTLTVLDSGDYSEFYSVDGTTIIPGLDFDGTLVAPVYVNDGEEEYSQSEIFPLAVFVENTNDAPILEFIEDQETDEDTPITITLSASDTEGSELNFSASTDTAAVTVSIVGGDLLTMTPSDDWHGTAYISVTVSDGSLTDSGTFSLTVNPVNDVPVLAEISIQITDEDTPLVLTLEVMNVDEDELTFSAVSEHPENVAAEVTGNQLTLSPAQDWYGTVNIFVSVSDGSLADSTSFSLSVNSVNDIPIGYIGTSYTETTGDKTFTVSYEDTEGDDVTWEYYYSIDFGSTWASADVEPGPGYITWHSLNDIPDYESRSILFKVIPFDNDEGESATTDYFAIDNDHSTAEILLAPAEYSGVVTIPYHLSDMGNDTLNLYLEYYQNQEWKLGTILDEGNIGVTEYDSSMVWDTPSDLNNLDLLNLLLRLTGEDEWDFGLSDSLVIHLDNEVGPQLLSNPQSISLRAPIDLEFDLPITESQLENHFEIISLYDTGVSEKLFVNRLDDHRFIRLSLDSLMSFASLDTITITILNSLTDTLGKGLDGDGDGDPEYGDEDNVTITVNTHLLADFDTTGVIDFDDLNRFVTAWDTTGENRDYSYELGPAAGTVPHLIPTYDNTFNIEDLVSFLRMWNWSDATALPRLAGAPFSGKQLDVSFESDELRMEIPDYDVGISGIYVQVQSQDGLWIDISDELTNLFSISLNRAWEDLNTQEWNMGLTNANSDFNSIVLGHIDVSQVDNPEFIIMYEIIGLDGSVLSRGTKTIHYIHVPGEFALHQNYPNPFNPVTTINYDLAKDGHISIVVYDLLGREVKTLINEVQNAGYTSIRWDGTDNRGKTLASGMYFYQMYTGDFILVRKMVLLK
ncbi:MAG: tandem-95 repeat protein [Candidatus Marinimicrobia bacterium]|nr:tandem-95 repeat protein [Candidatus Neomarinimicrobiota bacterium]